MSEKNWKDEGADWVEENLGDTLDELNALGVFAKYLLTLLDLCDHQCKNSKDRPEWWIERGKQLSKIRQDAGIVRTKPIKATGGIIGELQKIDKEEKENKK